jgi:SAM-dependent methyltransferase
MRKFVTDELIQWLSINRPKIESVAVVGGSPNEPELIEILKLYPRFSVHFFGVEELENLSNFTYFDLNSPQGSVNTFDLVICCQVLEHVWNIKTALENLKSLMNPVGGLLWLNCPASNMAHGSPEYFSAGYAKGYLIKNGTLLGLNSVHSGQLGSARQYFFTHALQYWPSDFEMKHPVLSFRPLRSYGRNFLGLTIRNFVGRFFSLLYSRKISFDLRYATESFILFEIKESSHP